MSCVSNVVLALVWCVLDLCLVCLMLFLLAASVFSSVYINYFCRSKILNLPVVTCFVFGTNNADSFTVLVGSKSILRKIHDQRI